MLNMVNMLVLMLMLLLVSRFSLVQIHVVQVYVFVPPCANPVSVRSLVGIVFVMFLLLLSFGTFCGSICSKVFGFLHPSDVQDSYILISYWKSCCISNFGIYS